MSTRYKLIVIVCAVIILRAILWNYRKIREGYDNNNPQVIGYFHICMIKGWEKSFDLLMNAIKNSGLYDRTKVIRVGVLVDKDKFEMNSRLKDPKIDIVYIGKKDEYERPTLLHMKKSSSIDPPNTLYYYLHTKGLRHFDTENEKTVLDWINSMLEWNVWKWKEVLERLKTYETYGVHYNDKHYAGNFWWATSKHIQKLSDTIPEYYTAPEDWVLTNKDNMYCAYNCGKEFKNPYEGKLYGF